MTVAEITSAILLWFASQNGSPWWECGVKYDQEHAVSRAGEYAEKIHHWSSKYRAPNSEKWMLSMLAAESGFDSCQIGSWARKKYGLPRSPTRKQAEGAIVLIAKKEKRKVDSGPFQVLWPALLHKGTTPAQAFDLDLQIQRVASYMPAHLRYCEFRYPKGIKVKGTKKSFTLPCSDGYWNFHNTGGSSFSVKYYRNVMYQARKLGLVFNS